MSTAIKILFLTANPEDASRLKLDEEIRAIKQALRQSDFRDKFDIEQQEAVRVSDLQGYLLQHKSVIVHFSGHGSAAGEIVLEDEAGESHPVSSRALGRLFDELKDDIRCVVLNACYSEKQAQAIAEHIDCVIGMSQEIGDAAALKFATAFYQALGYGRDVKTAFDLGCAQIDLEGLNEQDTPKLLAKRVDPERLFLISEHEAAITSPGASNTSKKPSRLTMGLAALAALGLIMALWFLGWHFGREAREASNLHAVAELQRANGEYAAAWESLEQAIALQPESSELQQAQMQLAMDWLRNIRVPEGQTFTEIVNKTIACLYRNVAMNKSAASADVLAHIGWANFLKWREGARGLKIEESFQEALNVDPDNAYAHAMWGFWMLWQNRKLEEAQPHFAAALNNGRDKEFVRRLQLQALQNIRNDDYTLELIRVANEMRKNNEDLPPEQRRRIESYVYYMYRRETLNALPAILPPEDHLATYKWLTQDFEDVGMLQRFWMARLTEAAGDLPQALALYRALSAEPDFERFTLYEEITAGIKRCSGQAP